MLLEILILGIRRPPPSSPPGNLICRFLGPERVTGDGGTVGFTATATSGDPGAGTYGEPLPWNMVHSEL